MVFLTGNKGYIGGHLHQAYPSAKTLDESRCFQRWEKLFSEIHNSKQQPTTIIHCGAIANSLYQDPDIFKWNYEATKQIANMAHKENAFFIFISS